MGNYHARFLGEEAPVMAPPYPVAQDSGCLVRSILLSMCRFLAGFHTMWESPDRKKTRFAHLTRRP